MKCKACKGEEFTKSKSGFLTCRTWGRQGERWEAEADMGEINAKHRRTVQSITEKVKKGRAVKQYLSQEDYLATYKSLLDKLTKSVEDLSKVELQETVNKIWVKFAPSHNLPNEIRPKNNRKRDLNDGSSYMQPQKFRDIEVKIAEIMQHYAQYNTLSYPGLIKCPFTTSQLRKELKNQQVPPLGTALPKRQDLILSLYFAADPDKQEQVLPEVIRASTSWQPCISMSTMLSIVAYASRIREGPTVHEILDWWGSLAVPYYKLDDSILQLPRTLQSLFTPFLLPSPQYIQMEVEKIHKLVGMNVGTNLEAWLQRIKKNLCLPDLVVEIGWKLFQRHKVDSTKEMGLLAWIFVAFKMIYGLDDFPYAKITKNEGTL